jgi:hypothetical protein
LNDPTANCATRTFSFAPSTSQIVCAPRWYTFRPGGCLRVHLLYEQAGRRARVRQYVPHPPCPGRGELERTICTSHEVPSVMYLKHRSQTHRTPPTFSRLLTAPEKRSIVRPCPIASSPSPSVSGYGEKYLWQKGGGRRMVNSPQPQNSKHEAGGKQRAHQVLICQGPKLTLSKFRRAEAVVGRAEEEGCVVSRASRSSPFASDGERRRLRVLVPFTRRDGIVSQPGDRESRGGVVARTVSTETHSSRRLSVPM